MCILHQAQISDEIKIPGILKRGARSLCGIILRSADCFDAPSHLTYVFVVREVNEIDIVNIVC